MTVADGWVAPTGAAGAEPVFEDSPYAWGQPPKRSSGRTMAIAIAAALFGLMLAGGVVLFLATGASAAGGCGGG